MVNKQSRYETLYSRLWKELSSGEKIDRANLLNEDLSDQSSKAGSARKSNRAHGRPRRGFSSSLLKMKIHSGVNSNNALKKIVTNAFLRTSTKGPNFRKDSLKVE